MAELLVVHEPYRRADQQRQADQLGMWLFLASEAMLFGVIFLTVALVHVLYPPAVRAAVGRLDWAGGAVETVVLLTSSLTMTLAIRASAEGRRRETLIELTATVLLGVAFEALKVQSWFAEYHQGLLPGHGPPFPLAEPGARLFFHLYFLATGLHAIHLGVAIAVAAVLAARLALRAPQQSVSVEMAGLYWHLVDMVWVFLFPALYLIG